jgi:hypothetical protein
MRHVRRWVGLTLTGASALAIAPSCRAPTEMIVHVTTTSACGSDVNQVGATAIYVGGDAATAEAHMQSHSPDAQTTSCVGGEIGTLVVTPHGSSGAVVVVAGVHGKNPKECDESSLADCIVARRSFSFLSHTPLNLPIVLDVDCVGVSCDPNSTCEHGQCYASDVGCRAGQDCADPEQQADGAVADVESPSVDAASDATSASDGSIGGADSGVLDAGKDGSILPMVDAGKDAGLGPVCQKDKSAAFLEVTNCGGTTCAGDYVCCFAPVGPLSKIVCRIDPSTSTCQSPRACCSNADCGNGTSKCCMVQGDPFTTTMQPPFCGLPVAGQIGVCF